MRKVLKGCPKARGDAPTFPKMPHLQDKSPSLRTHGATLPHFSISPPRFSSPLYLPPHPTSSFLAQHPDSYTLINCSLCAFYASVAVDFCRVEFFSFLIDKFNETHNSSSTLCCQLHFTFDILYWIYPKISSISIFWPFFVLKFICTKFSFPHVSSFFS